MSKNNKHMIPGNCVKYSKQKIQFISEAELKEEGLYLLCQL